jgi:hypothetical protein
MSGRGDHDGEAEQGSGPAAQWCARGGEEHRDSRYEMHKCRSVIFF